MKWKKKNMIQEIVNYDQTLTLMLARKYNLKSVFIFQKKSGF